MAGDELAPLIERHIPALRRYAYGLVRDPDRADDLVQDCLERALARWYLRRPGGDARAWLFTILRNRYIDAHRTGRRRGLHLPLDSAPAQEVAPEQEAGLETRDILAALDHLPEEQKSILLLIGVEEFSYEEAARVLGVPVGTVMSRLSRARRRLRAILESGHAPQLRRVK